jgi:hypothetical protein
MAHHINLWQRSGLSVLLMTIAVIATFARPILMPVPLVVMTLVYFGAYYIAFCIQPKPPVRLGVILVGAASQGYFIFHTNNNPNFWLNCMLAILLALGLLLILFGTDKRKPEFRRMPGGPS